MEDSEKPKKYTCPICNHGFNRPKVKYMGSFILEFGLYIIFVLGGGIALGGIGCFFGFLIGVFFSFIRAASRKKICPFCGSENFYRNDGN